MRGSIAFPDNPIIKREEPVLVNLPKLCIDKGQIPAYINAFGKPIDAKK